MATTLDEAPKRPPRRPWRFGLRTLLVVILACGVGLTAWRYRHEQHLNQIMRSMSSQANVGADPSQGSDDVAMRFGIGQMVKHRSFRAAGLYHRVMATHDGFGEIQLLCIECAEFDRGHQKEICLMFYDRSGPPHQLVVVFAPHTQHLSWMEFPADGKSQWHARLKRHDGGPPQLEATSRGPGKRNKRLYELRSQGIELIEESPVIDQAAEDASLLRAMGIDSQPRKSTSSGFEGPESDLQ